MIEETELAGVVKVTPKRFEDARGYFAETFNPEMARAAGLPAFVQDNESLSRTPGTLRGLHLQTPPFAQAKFVRCVVGSVLDVSVDVRRSSPTFGQHIAVNLSAENGVMLFLPCGVAHGFVTLEPDTLVSYRVDARYSAAHERGLAWNDPELGIDWPVETPSVLSEKDANHPSFAALMEELAEVEW